MKRLIRRSKFDTPMDGMIQLDEMDEAEIRHDRCPYDTNNLERSDGFKKCPMCGRIYKTFDGNAYLVPN